MATVSCFIRSSDERAAECGQTTGVEPPLEFPALSKEGISGRNPPSVAKGPADGRSLLMTHVLLTNGPPLASVEDLHSPLREMLSVHQSD